MAKARKYWLMKSEPDVYSWDDLVRDGRTHWDGVRNYQARNMMRDEMKVGDGVLYYHSNAKPMCIAGVAKVVKEGYPDPSAFDRKSKYHDPDSDEADPTWFCVDIAPVVGFDEPVTRDQLKDDPKLAEMMVLQRGARLSVQPVSAAHFKHICKMAGARADW
jgi:predicted RNA-binding protein with PUA-like domain